MTEQDWLMRKVEEHYDGMHWDEVSGRWLDRYGTPIHTTPWRQIRRSFGPKFEAEVARLRAKMEAELE